MFECIMYRFLKKSRSTTKFVYVIKMRQNTLNIIIESYVDFYVDCSGGFGDFNKHKLNKHITIQKT